jgi:aconitate hydratase
MKKIDLRCRIDTDTEIDYVKHGGVLHYVLRSLAGLNETAKANHLGTAKNPRL